MDYHSAQFTGRRRFTGGLEFLAAYTFGKTLTDNRGYYGSTNSSAEGAYWQNAYDRQSNRGPAFFDVRHSFTVGGVWALPYGHGQKFGSNSHAVVNAVLGGWSANYSLAARGGIPMTVFANDRTNQAVRGNVRANRYKELQVDESARTIDNFFGLPAARTGIFCAAGVNDGACAYGQPADGLFGSSGIGTERGPSYFNLDLSVGKKFNITERQYIDFRAEFFNALNHVSWVPPALNINSPATFGTITSQVQNPRNIQFGLKYYF